MSYIVSYRNSEGKLEQMTLEAASRVDVFKELEARGIRAVSVIEGKSAAKKARRIEGVSRRGKGRGLIAGLIVILGASAAFFFLTRSEPMEKADVKEAKKTGGKLVEVAPEIVTNRPVEKVKKVDEIEEKKRWAAERREKLRKMTPQERLDYLYAEAEKTPINLEPASNRIFATGTEQIIDWIFNTTPGDVPPILPQIPMFEEAHLTEILFNKNLILDTDDENIIEHKQNVDLAKKEMIRFITAGGMPDEFLAHYRDILVNAHMEYQNSQKEVFKMLKEDPEGAVLYLDAVNQRLEEKGIKPVKIPGPMARRYGLEMSE